MSDIDWKGGIIAAPHAVIIYEPLGEWKFAYWVKTGMEGVAHRQ
jgi:hypothetical protein